MAVRVQVLGSGDAFGSGGRAQTCFLVEAAGRRVLIDCGATALVSMRRFGVLPESIEAVVLTHLHGDHFGGVPFLLHYARHVARRPWDLHIAGPQGTQARTLGALDALYVDAGRSMEALQGRGVLARFEEYVPGVRFAVGPAQATALRVVHSDKQPCHGVRLDIEGRVVAYSGDTEWTETLVDLADGADLFIVDCQAWTDPPPGHLAFDELRRRLPALRAKRLLLTHMGEPMRARAPEVADDRVLVADDGLVVEV
jgi:ribonuclease BN (tRNA processing enzyme)